jgi:hypothetical protein
LNEFVPPGPLDGEDVHFGELVSNGVVDRVLAVDDVC